MRNVFVKPAVAGNIIRDPGTKIALKADGDWKPANQFWLRRIAQGDVVEATVDQKKLQADLAAKATADAAAAAAAAKVAADQVPVMAPAMKASKS
jgi:hypothetical protein